MAADEIPSVADLIHIQTELFDEALAAEIEDWNSDVDRAIAKLLQAGRGNEEIIGMFKEMKMVELSWLASMIWDPSLCVWLNEQ